MKESVDMIKCDLLFLVKECAVTQIRLLLSCTRNKKELLTQDQHISKGFFLRIINKFSMSLQFVRNPRRNDFGVMSRKSIDGNCVQL